jgi:hypothetical protein
MMLAVVWFNNIQGLAQKYDRMRANLPRAELHIVCRFKISVPLEGWVMLCNVLYNRGYMTSYLYITC